MDDKIRHIAQKRAEGLTEVRDALAPFMARCHLGEQRAVLIVGIRTDGTGDISAAASPDDVDRLIGMLERAKAQLLED